MLKLAFQNMRYYKSQTMAIFFSIFLTAALLSGIGSLLYSSQLNETENSKRIYGNWHYALPSNPQLLKSIKKGDREQGFFLEQYGVKEIRETITTPYEISFVWSDTSYLKMTDRELVTGNYPATPGELAADIFTLSNLGYKGEPGEIITLNKTEYTLSGILNSPWAADTDHMEVFVSEDFKSTDVLSTLYVKFREEGKLYRQLYAFLDYYKISGNDVKNNDKVTKYLGGEEPEHLYQILKFALTDEKGNFTYIVLKLQAEYNLAFYGMVLLLCVFSLCVIYSIFQISVSKRILQYGIMETLGISDRALGGTLLAELWMLFLIGYPLGCLAGNSILKLSYRRLAGVFTPLYFSANAQEISAADSLSLGDTKTPQFHTACWVMLIGFLFLFFAMFLIGILTLLSLKKQTLRQAMAEDPCFLKGSRKIYSRRNRNLTGVVIRKFMFSNPKKITGILLSLSMGGCIFLCTTYMVENLKIHAEMSLKSDEGLSSPYRISLMSHTPGDTIPKETVEEIKELPQLAEIHATKYIPGEITIGKTELEWDEYFDERNKDSYFRERFGGICVSRGNNYGIKYNVYGYDSNLITQLKDYILEGEISEKDWEKGNKIIAVANQDGQGNFNFYGKHPGDTLLLKVPKAFKDDGEILRFENPKKDYLEMEFELAAIVSRPLTQENRFFNVNGWKNHPSLILSNPQMERLYHIADYSFLDIEPVKGANDAFFDALLQAIQNVPRAVLKDDTKAIQAQRNYLGQQQLFFTGIAVIFLAISLFHIMNSANHSILSHRREYGIILSMGITKGQFYRMILSAGIFYGILTDVFIFLLYHIFLRQAMNYYMAHVLQFLHFTAAVPREIFIMVLVLNLLISLIAVLIPAGKILKAEVLENL